MKPILCAYIHPAKQEFSERSKPKAVRDSPTLGVARSHSHSALEANPVGLPEARSRSISQQNNDEFFPTAEPVLLLDNIEQLGTRRKPKPTKEAGNVAASSEAEKFEALRKRARAKYYTSRVALGLYGLDSPLKTSYGTTYWQCAETLEQNGTKVTSRYCGHRWCVVCNRIRTANLIKGYEGPLSLLEDLQFVTLTLPNVLACYLRETIERMIKMAQTIQNYFKKRKQRGLQGWQLVGIRKLECTYNVKTGLFHPHFHFLVSSKEAAKALQAEWLRRVETATYKAQDVRKAGKGSEKELFKYFAKMVTKVDGKNATLLEPLDVIYQAMRGLRVFQPMGLKKEVSEEVEELKAVEVVGIKPVEEITLWGWGGNDWVDHGTGEALTGYIPSEQAEELNSNIVLNVDELRKPKLFELDYKPHILKPFTPDFSEHRGRVLEGLDFSFQAWEKAFGLVVKKKRLKRRINAEKRLKNG